MRKAKIVCTLGPASESVRVLTEMVRAGMDVARLNFSHGTHDEHARRIDTVRAVSKKLQKPIALLQDIQGPKIRLGEFQGTGLSVRRGETVTLTTRDVLGRPGLIPVTLKSLPHEVSRGDPILLDDGRVELEVISIRRSEVQARVVRGGTLANHKGLNLPGSPVSVQSITPKDEVDLAFGQEMGVDFVGLSFVRSARDVQLARRHVQKNQTPLIAKIEKPQAVDDLEAIAAAADGVMVARGDLGVELPLERVPSIQKRIIRVVNARGGMTIVATEMLESMVHNQRPTRAEVSDVANAIADGAGAVMLSGETAVGDHPAAVVGTMARIVEEAERSLDIHRPDPFSGLHDIATAVAAAATVASRHMNAGLIAAYTESGATARLISELRPPVPIVALTPNEEVVRRMALFWGVQPMLAARQSSTDAMIEQVRALCRRRRLVKVGSPIVMVAGLPLNEPGNTNLMTIHRC